MLFMIILYFIKYKIQTRTIIPKPIRYQPKEEKLFFWMNLRKNFTPIIAVIKAVIKPIIQIISSLLLKLRGVLYKSRAVAASMVGIAKRKENSTIVFLFIPKLRPPIIVAAARDTPGIIASA